jgi:hypothetical protein
MPPKPYAEHSWTPELPIPDDKWEIVAQERALGRTVDEALSAAGIQQTVKSGNSGKIYTYRREQVNKRTDHLIAQRLLQAKASDKQALVTREQKVAFLWDLAHEKECPYAVRVAAVARIDQIDARAEGGAKDVRALTSAFVKLMSTSKGGFVYPDNPKEVSLEVVKGDAADSAIGEYDPVQEAEQDGDRAVAKRLAMAEGA